MATLKLLRHHLRCRQKIPMLNKGFSQYTYMLRKHYIIVLNYVILIRMSVLYLICNINILKFQNVKLLIKSLIVSLQT